MGKVYQRKSTRASFGEDVLAEALQKVKSGDMGVNEASRTYGISSRTLRRHLKTGTSEIRLGRKPDLGTAHEKRLVAHIKALEKVGYAPDADSVKKLAFSFAEKLGIAHRFSVETKAAGKEWFRAFLRRNPELSVRKAEGLSLARAKGMNREDVGNFFKLLEEVLIENDLVDKPGKIFNVDETGIQINNKAGKVLATKGAKDVYTLTSSEKGENVSVISCCNAEGQFLPPVLIFKGKNKKDEFVDGLPPGSNVFMNPKSSYINSDLFLKWFKEYFLLKKGSGKAVLVLDGHASHCNAIELLDVAVENEVSLICLPSHTTQALQPLDRAFFKPLKTFFFQEARIWMVQNKNRNMSRINIAKLIGNAWCKAATVANGIAGFRACGIFPFNPHAIPDHFYSISDASLEVSRTSDAIEESRQLSPVASGSKEVGQVEETVEKETPSKYLLEENPIPTIPTQVSKRKQQALELTSPVNRAKRRVLSEIKEKKDKKTSQAKNGNKKNQPVSKNIRGTPKRVRRVDESSESSSNTETDLVMESSDEVSDELEDICIKCREYYYTTKSKVDWIQCTECHGWLHETCTSHGSVCDVCAKNVQSESS